MRRFCTIGISSIGISTPISPRATIIASETLIISSIFSTPAAFSILAIIRISWQSLRSSRSRILTISAAHCVNDAAMKSKSSAIPNSISEISRSDKNGSESFTPGTLTPLRSDILPPLTTRQVIPEQLLSVTRSSMRPSSMRIRLPTLTSRHRSLYVTDTCVASPIISSNTNLNSASRSSITGSESLPMRISGPFVSSSSAVCAPSSALACFIISAIRLCPS